MSTTEQNKNIVKQYVECFNRGDWTKIQDLFTVDAEIHGVLGSGSVKEILPIWHDLHDKLTMELTISDISAEGDHVAVKYIERGKSSGDFKGYKATGKTYEITAIEWFIFKDGKIHRRWGARDSMTVMKQLGFTT